MFTSFVPAFIRRAFLRKPATIVKSAVDSRGLPGLYPWKDIDQRLAIHCGESTRKLMRVHSAPAPAYATPSVSLEQFIEHILRQSRAPLSASLGALAIITWMTQYQKAPLSSSSPHHLFLSSYQLVVQSIWGLHWDDEEWVAMTEGHIPEKEIVAIKLEVADAMMAESRTTREWELLSLITQDSTTELIRDMFDLERIQSGSDLFEGKEMREMEYDLRISGRWVVYDDEDEEL